ncbi:MAG: hydroxyacylglutathione hydrolase [Proteobacteria bacterium]|nr:hydroxyacylglutathione hydrolase [Pseudomonadota bacterium]
MVFSIRQFRYGADNLAYVVHAGGEAMAIDGGAAQEILGFLRERRLVLKIVTNTHGHGDHTPGNVALLGASSAALLEPSALSKRPEPIPLGGGRIEVIPTPGHSRDSITFYTGAAAITGDTLFNFTIGNCFTGDLGAFHASIRALMALPDATLVYAGHDYVRDSLEAAARLEPGNPEIAPCLGRYVPEHVVSTLGDERRVNPYLRFDEPSIVALLAARGLPIATERDRWRSLMSIG